MCSAQLRHSWRGCCTVDAPRSGNPKCQPASTGATPRHTGRASGRQLGNRQPGNQAPVDMKMSHMAGKGFAAKDILAFYYQGAELTTLQP